MRVLACDPSFTAWGWSVLDIDKKDIKVIKTGTIKTEPTAKKQRIRKTDDTGRRITEIAQKLLEVLDDYSIDIIVSEAPHGSQSATAAVMMGAVQAILQTLSVTQDVPLEWYSEGEAKKALGGAASLAKQETIRLISQKYDVEWTGVGYKDESVADSLAVFHVAFQMSEMIRFFRRNVS